MNFKRLRTVLYDLVYAFLTLGLIFFVVILNGMTGYLDPIFGVQVILVLVSLVWAPLAILTAHRHD